MVRFSKRARRLVASLSTTTGIAVLSVLSVAVVAAMAATGDGNVLGRILIAETPPPPPPGGMPPPPPSGGSYMPPPGGYMPPPGGMPMGGDPCNTAPNPDECRRNMAANPPYGGTSGGMPTGAATNTSGTPGTTGAQTGTSGPVFSADACSGCKQHMCGGQMCPMCNMVCGVKTDAAPGTGTQGDQKMMGAMDSAQCIKGCNEMQGKTDAEKKMCVDGCNKPSSGGAQTGGGQQGSCPAGQKLCGPKCAGVGDKMVCPAVMPSCKPIAECDADSEGGTKTGGGQQGDNVNMACPKECAAKYSGNPDKVNACMRSCGGNDDMGGGYKGGYKGGYENQPYEGDHPFFGSADGKSLKSASLPSTIMNLTPADSIAADSAETDAQLQKAESSIEKAVNAFVKKVDRVLNKWLAIEKQLDQKGPTETVLGKIQKFGMQLEPLVAGLGELCEKIGTYAGMGSTTIDEADEKCFTKYEAGSEILDQAASHFTSSDDEDEEEGGGDASHAAASEGGAAADADAGATAQTEKKTAAQPTTLPFDPTHLSVEDFGKLMYYFDLWTSTMKGKEYMSPAAVEGRKLRKDLDLVKSEVFDAVKGSQIGIFANLFAKLSTSRYELLKNTILPGAQALLDGGQ